MTWSNNFTFNESYAAYYGDVDSNAFHHHAAIQIVCGVGEPVTLTMKSGSSFTGKGFVIRPLVDHKVECRSNVAMIYLEPHSLISFEAMRHQGLGNIEPLSAELCSKIDVGKAQNHWLDDLIPTGSNHMSSPDKRLSRALELLKSAPGELSITQTANVVGISDSRLRTLVREQMGVSISTWLIWRKLHQSVYQLSQGATLADAAIAGGFSDQAHFTRAMKRMLGVTPQVAAKAVTLK